MEVIGHRKIKEQLLNCIHNQKIPSSLLFIGNSNIGKTLVAIEFAKQLNLKSDSRNLETNKKLFEQATHPDFKVVKPDKTQIKISQIKDIIRFTETKPTFAKYRIIVVKEANLMGNEAANAFLKVLEEPPQNTIFILTTAKKEALLPTILSRCTKLFFSDLTQEQMQQVLTEKSALSSNQIKTIIPYLSGSLLKSWIDKPNEVLSLREKLIRVLINLKQHLNKDVFETIDWIIEKNLWKESLRILFSYFFDLKLLSLRQKKYVHNQDLLEDLNYLVKNELSNEAEKICSIIEQTENTIQRYTNKGLALEALFIQITAILNGRLCF